MRVPQVTDRLKEAPAQALRAVFSGVGSVLLVADRLRHRPGQETGQGNGHAGPAGDCPGRHVPRRDSAGPIWRFPRRPGRPGSQGGQSRQSQFRQGQFRWPVRSTPSPSHPSGPTHLGGLTSSGEERRQAREGHRASPGEERERVREGRPAPANGRELGL